jgi:ATP-binding cassette, subfamily B, bacterial PglK
MSISSTQRYFSKFFYVLGQQRKKLIFLVLLFIFTSFMEMVGIGLVGPFVAIATNLDFIRQNDRLNWLYQQLGFTSESQMLLLFGALVVGIFYIKAFLAFSIQKKILDFSFTQRSHLCSRLLHAYSSAPYTYHLKQNSAALIQNMMTETEAFGYKVLMPGLFATANSVIILAIVLLLVKTNAMAVFVILGMFLLSFGLFQRFKDKLAFWGKERSESYENLIRIVNHSLGGLKETRVIGCESYFEEQAKIELHRNATSGASYLAFSSLPRYVIEAFLITFLVGFTFIFMMFNRQSGESLNSVLGIFAMASIRVLPALGIVINSLSDLRYSTHTLDRLYSDLKGLEKFELPNQPQQNLTNVSFKKKVSLEQIEYRYPGVDEDALRRVSLTFRKGESIGLIGRSGAGKTTLVDVILGLLIPTNGDIKIDGNSIYQNLRSWQNLIGYVPQTIFLSDDTLERNIAFGVPDHLIDQKRMTEAIQAAQLNELVKELPQGLQTRIGERGVRLSGGQRQRIGIARVLYHDRQIIILDEATAALDNETESLVSEAVKSLGGQKTIIIIAHRLSTIEHCDRIYQLEKGQITKSGNYQDVVLNQPA